MVSALARKAKPGGGDRWIARPLRQSSRAVRHGVGLPRNAFGSAAYAAAAAASGLALSPIRWQIANTRSARFIV